MGTASTGNSPDLDDRFATNAGPTVAAVGRRFGPDGTTPIDVGSGTGRSTFELAKVARVVVGLEPWDAMRAVAVDRHRALGPPNVAFVKGAAEQMPFPARAADHVVSFAGFPFWFVDAGNEGRRLGERFVADCARIVRPGGRVVAVNGAPGWEMGDPAPLLRPAGEERERGHDRVGERVQAHLAALGFAHEDVLVDGDDGSVQEAVATYGFIYGRKAIDYLVANGRSSIRWNARIHHRRAVP